MSTLVTFFSAEGTIVSGKMHLIMMLAGGDLKGDANVYYNWSGAESYGTLIIPTYSRTTTVQMSPSEYGELANENLKGGIYCVE